MHIDRIAHRRSAVVVLGAGATRGASFVPELEGVLPPLDTDFFTQAQRLSRKKPSNLIKDVLSHTVNLFGENFQLTMEGFLTHIEHLDHVHEDYKLQGRPGKNDYRTMRSSFLQLFAAVLDEAIGRKRECRYHAVLVKALSTKDTILSFNYDWLIDSTLRKLARGKWNPVNGYGVRVYRRRGCKYWACKDNSGNPEYAPRSITLLKMHGSMNWFPVPADMRPIRLRLRERWWHQNGELRFEIAPPEWNKPIRSGIYQEVWRGARRALRKAKTLVFIGYSLPETDLPARALFMVDAGVKRIAPLLSLLVIVNPDHGARVRIRRVLAGRIGPKTRIITFDTLAEFSKFLGWSPSENNENPAAH